jgi:hypothetical protein
MTTALRKIDAERAKLERRLEKLDDDRLAAIGARRWRCRAAGCGRTSKLSSVILVQTHWYVEPYSCSGGDYWRSGERNLVCPKCSVRHRMINKDPRPDNFYDLSMAKQDEIEKAERPVEERRLGVLDDLTRGKVFDHVVDQYDESYHPIRMNGEDVAKPRDRRSSYGRAEIADMYGLDAGALATFVIV